MIFNKYCRCLFFKEHRNLGTEAGGDGEAGGVGTLPSEREGMVIVLLLSIVKTRFSTFEWKCVTFSDI